MGGERRGEKRRAEETRGYKKIPLLNKSRKNIKVISQPSYQVTQTEKKNHKKFHIFPHRRQPYPPTPSHVVKSLIIVHHLVVYILHPTSQSIYTVYI